jgi:predicted transglutaminase-like cysteine proteinase
MSWRTAPGSEKPYYGAARSCSAVALGGLTVMFSVFSARLGAGLIAALAACSACAFPATAEPKQLSHLPVTNVTSPPIGWIDLCTREPHECVGIFMTMHEFVITPRHWSDLARINKLVNATIKPLTDFEHWGVAERWSYPDDGYGDCEDYVLLKRRLLIQLGWPREALLITVVRDKKGEGHAVLMVTTDRGDYILDNQNDRVVLWGETGYRFIKRQSSSDPNVWVSLGNPRPVVATATAR